jgi:glutaredoxin
MIKIYTIPECKYCNELKEILITENIEFNEVNVMLAENEEEYRKINEISKSDQVPIVLIGKQLLIPEVSFKSIRECVDLTIRFTKEQ